MGKTFGKVLLDQLWKFFFGRFFWDLAWPRNVLSAWPRSVLRKVAS